MSKVIVGDVVSAVNDKTIIIRVDSRKTHPIYGKKYTVSNKLVAHDEDNQAEVGDRVEITEARQVSKTKSWKLVRVINAHLKPKDSSK